MGVIWGRDRLGLGLRGEMVRGEMVRGEMVRGEGGTWLEGVRGWRGYLWGDKLCVCVCVCVCVGGGGVVCGGGGRSWLNGIKISQIGRLILTIISSSQLLYITDSYC